MALSLDALIRTRPLAISALLLTSAACSPAPTGRDEGSRPSGGSGPTGGGGVANAPGVGPGINLGGGETAGAGPVDPNEACATESAGATLMKEAVDIILVLDNSGSMADELESVEQNINTNFANILSTSDVDYRVILISRHRREVRAMSGESSTSVCVSAPLGGLPACPALIPVNSERFFHYNIKIESTDSFDRILGTYRVPDERYMLTPTGWSAWLRPGAKKVFLELTDDNEDMPVDTFVPALQATAPEHFGTSPTNLTFVFHSITGILQKTPATEPYLPDEPVQMGTCTGGGNDVTNAGAAYQELSRRTGGLRFPLCEFSAYDVVFRRIAEDVVVKSNIACDFPIPAPPAGRMLDLAKVGVRHTLGGGGTADFGQAATITDCRPNAFYIANDRIVLCPETCDAVRADVGASVDVLFTCESQILPPR